MYLVDRLLRKKKRKKVNVDYHFIFLYFLYKQCTAFASDRFR